MENSIKNQAGNKTLTVIKDGVINEKEIIDKAIKGLISLKDIPDDLRNNKRFVSLYFQNAKYTYSQIQYLSENLRNDLLFLQTLNASKSDILKCGGDKIKDNEKLVIEHCESGFCSGLGNASERIRNDRRIVLRLYEQNKDIRKYVGKQLLNDRTFALEACSISGKIFEYLSEELRDDEEVARIAFVTEPFMITYASDRIKGIKELAFECFERNIKVYPAIAEFYREDCDFVPVLVKNLEQVRSEWFAYLPETYKNNKDFIKKWLCHCGNSYKYLPESMKIDKELAFIALKNGEVLWNIHPKLLDDFDFVYEYLINSHNKFSNKCYDYEYFSERIKNDPIILLAALDEHIPHIYDWQCDDVGNTYEINYYDIIKSECFKDEEFTKIIINAFFKTPFANDYNYDEVMKTPFSIYEIMRELLNRRDLYFFQEEPDPSIGLNFKEDINKMMIERRDKKEIKKRFKKA